MFGRFVFVVSKCKRHIPDSMQEVSVVCVVAWSWHFLLSSKFYRDEEASLPQFTPRRRVLSLTANPGSEKRKHSVLGVAGFSRGLELFRQSWNLFIFSARKQTNCGFASTRTFLSVHQTRIKCTKQCSAPEMFLLTAWSQHIRNHHH